MIMLEPRTATDEFARTVIGDADFGGLDIGDRTPKAGLAGPILLPIVERITSRRSAWAHDWQIGLPWSPVLPATSGGRSRFGSPRRARASSSLDATEGAATPSWRPSPLRAVRPEFVEADLDGSVERSRSLAERASAVFGVVEILVNNAGVYPPGSTLAIDGDTFDRIFSVNVKAPYFLTAALVPHMMASGGGVVINLGSWGARLGLPGGTAYAATKGAMETLTRAWAAEFGARGIRVNAVSPGVTFDGNNPVADVAAPMMDSTPLGRLVRPDAVARAAVYLASDDAQDVHATVLDVDGGRSSVLVSAR